MQEFNSIEQNKLKSDELKKRLLIHWSKLGVIVGKSVSQDLIKNYGMSKVTLSRWLHGKIYIKEENQKKVNSFLDKNESKRVCDIYHEKKFKKFCE